MKINVIEKWRSKCITHYHIIISQHLLRHFFDHINFLFLILIFNFAPQNIAKKTVFFIFLISYLLICFFFLIFFSYLFSYFNFFYFNFLFQFFFILISYFNFFFSCKTTKFQGRRYKNQDRERWIQDRDTRERWE